MDPTTGLIRGGSFEEAKTTNKPATLAAVKCKVCGRLHEADGTTYVTMTGALIRRRRGRHTVEERPIPFGMSLDPTVVCDTTSCVMKLMFPENHGFGEG